VPADYTPYAQGGWKEEYKEWCDVEKFADSVYIFNTASDPGSVLFKQSFDQAVTFMFHQDKFTPRAIYCTIR
jgi:hypothetical protein